ncbi:GTP pyrophosphokinase [Vibrio rumoiensis]|uniref:RelA/SpoT domain-containing protein n=1 Tax=Vibrio rumoiensis 1S-45 TaxID=1188252 RepID=A0A1E5E4Y6_9VIBR|nr:hypothetical protein [Vibrio rumoiensis]OEF27586.1 hypothetical protein A1QC_14795 [Vibrio rumoiensis 1S-45]
MSLSKIIDEYDEQLSLNEEMAQSMVALISALLSNEAIVPHSVSSRVKDRNSLSRKVTNKDKYTSIQDITDIVGIRIISNYSDEVDQIAKIIEDNFAIDAKNSIDKRASLDPDRFGYLSLHYVVSISQDRERLIEYQRFNGRKVEIQIRSVLQHAWAEIEHDIGYKSTIEVPKHVRRQFSRLASLLELADEGFVKIKEELTNYQNDVEENISSKPDEVEIDLVTILEFLNKSDIVNKLDRKVAEKAKFNLKELDSEFVSRHLKYLQYFNISKISELILIINENEKNILLRANDINSEGDTASKGISIFYLYHILAAKLGNKEKIMTFLDEMGLCLEDDRDGFADYLIELSTEFV